jgi:hypothetical protein
MLCLERVGKTPLIIVAMLGMFAIASLTWLHHMEGAFDMDDRTSSGLSPFETIWPT